MKNKLKFKDRWKRYIAFCLALFIVLSLLPTIPVQASTMLYNEAVLKVSKTSKEYDLTPAGVNKNGRIFEMELDETKGFCMDAGKHASSGKKYARTGTADDTYRKIISYALYDDIAAMHLRFSVGKWSESNYALAQALVWGYTEGCSAYETAILMDIILSDTSEHWREGKANNPDFLKMVSETWVESALTFDRQSVGTVYIYDSGIGENQRILTTTQGTKAFAKYNEVSSSKSYTATDSVTLSIQKTDKETSKPLSNVSFDLYKDNIKVTTVTTDSKGNAFYTFKEESTKTATSKKEYCSNYQELSIPNQNQINIEFISKEQAQSAADEEAYAKAKIEAEKLYSATHTYKAVETKTKEAYFLNSSTATQSITYVKGDKDGIITFYFANTRQTGTIEILKKDSETGYLVDGAVYGLYAKEDIVHPDEKTGIVYTKDSLVGTFPETGINGKTSLSNLYLGKYYVKEIQAPVGYVLSTEIYDVELSFAGQSASVTDASAIVTDRVQRGSIHVFKLDKELSNGKDATVFDNNKDGAQGDASIVGATYGLYAKEDIVHADGKTGIVTYNDVAGSIHALKATKGTDFKVMNKKARKDTLLATIKTDENGEFGFENLYNGKYYIKEIKASDGYLLDQTEYEVDLSYVNQNESVVMKSISVFESVKKQAFDLVKVGHASGSSQVAKPLEGVEFTVKLESDVIRLGWENAPVYDVLKTDVEGKASSIELPFGYYRVRETKTGDNYNTANDFFVTIEEDNRTHQTFSNHIIVDEEYQALLKIMKLDKTSGKPVKVAGAEFKLKALTDVTVDGKRFDSGEYIGYWNWNIFDGFYTDTWKTNEDGYVLLNEKLGTGTYQIEEIHAPLGYVLDTEPVTFKVSNSDMHNISQDGKSQVIVVEKTDSSVKGQIRLEKRGEVLTDFKDGQFIYEEKGLADAKFNIIAKEDILDPANDGTILYAKETIIETLITDENGKASSSKLPLGKYLVKEIEAPYGMVINEKTKTVELKYVDENTPIVFENISIVNERQKVVLDFNKLDAEEFTPIAGAEFTLYANKNIVNYIGETILSKDSVVTTTVSDSDGKLVFDVDLPIDLDSSIEDSNEMFYLIETKRPVGYATLNEIFYLDTTYQGQNLKNVTISYDIYNEIIRASVSKTDIATGEPVIGAELSIIPVDENGIPKLGETFTTWISGETAHLVKGLEPGEYILREKLGKASELGYVTAKDVYFTVKDTGDIQKFEMKDGVTSIRIMKVDQDENALLGATLSLIPLDENSEPKYGESFVTWVTTEEAHIIERLPVGKYMLKELSAPDGYYLAEPIIIEVLDTDEIQTFTMVNEIILTDIKVNKVDSVTKEAIHSKDFVFGLYTDKECTQLIAIVHANTETSTATFENIRYGTYYIKEIEAPMGYVLSDEVKEITINDELEGVGEVYSFDYENSLIPVAIVETGDHATMLPFLCFGIFGLSAIGFGIKRKRMK